MAVKANESLNIFEITVTNASKKSQAECQYWDLQKKYQNFQKLTKILIFILEMFYDFPCEEGRDLSVYLFGYK